MVQIACPVLLLTSTCPDIIKFFLSVSGMLAYRDKEFAQGLVSVIFAPSHTKLKCEVFFCQRSQRALSEETGLSRVGWFRSFAG